MTKYDVVIIGGGFYGCMLALFLRARFKKVLIIEKEKDLLTKASCNNQARVHNGYHYPRSFVTAFRSHVNFGRFTAEFRQAIDDEFTMIYAVAKNSKVTGAQFKKFCLAVGSKIEPAPLAIKKLFNPSLIEEVFLVEEVAYDAIKLRNILKKKLSKKKVKILYGISVEKVNKDNESVMLTISSGKKIVANQVFNCTYSQINTIIKNSELPLLPFKYELTEMPLIKMPIALQDFGFTIIDGPFFSLFPFPSKKPLHTLHHVRYTPHETWFNDEKKINKKPKSKFIYMLKDMQRFMPILKDVKYVSSLYEVKTILSENEINDGRPILYRENYGMENFNVVMGGKIDNIYDILERVDQSLKVRN